VDELDVIIYPISLIQPHFDYCSSVWGNLGKVLGCKLQKLQNRTARIIAGSDYNVRSAQILNSLNWDNLEKRHSPQFGESYCIKRLTKWCPTSKFTPTNVITQLQVVPLCRCKAFCPKIFDLVALRKVLRIEEPSCGIAYVTNL
jgi:hypothetical protein